MKKYYVTLREVNETTVIVNATSKEKAEEVVFGVIEEGNGEIQADQCIEQTVTAEPYEEGEEELCGFKEYSEIPDSDEN